MSHGSTSGSGIAGAGLIAAAACAMSMGGCAGQLNSGMVVGDPLKPSQQYAPPSIVAPAGEARAESGSGEVAERSVTSLDRSDWTGMRVNVPNDVPMHQPRYTENVEFDRSTARNRGDYPTATSALDTVSSKSEDLQIKEAVFAPFIAGADVALMPARMIQARPWQRTQTGSDPYKRAPVSRADRETGLTPVEDGPVTIYGGETTPAGPKLRTENPLRKVDLPPENSLKRYPVSPGALAPSAPAAPKAAPAKPAPNGATEPPEDEPKWNRPPVATDERGKVQPTPAKPEEEKK